MGYPRRVRVPGYPRVRPSQPMAVPIPPERVQVNARSRYRYAQKYLRVTHADHYLQRTSSLVAVVSHYTCHNYILQYKLHCLLQIVVTYDVDVFCYSESSFLNPPKHLLYLLTKISLGLSNYDYIIFFTII